MIIENAFVKEIIMTEATVKEFIKQFGTAVDMLAHATEKSYEKMNADQFLDWAKDLWWISERNLIFIIKGKTSDDIRRLMESIISFWKDEAEHVIVGGKSKQVDFILLDK